jgi:hypothetical protein
MNWRSTTVIVAAFSYFRWDGEAARVIGGIVTNLFALFCSLLCFTKTGAVRGSRICSFPLHSCVHARPGRPCGRRQEMRLRQHHQRPLLPPYLHPRTSQNKPASSLVGCTATDMFACSSPLQEYPSDDLLFGPPVSARCWLQTRSLQRIAKRRYRPEGLGGFDW